LHQQQDQLLLLQGLPLQLDLKLLEGTSSAVLVQPAWLWAG
jgi:hypothetical protein